MIKYFFAVIFLFCIPQIMFANNFSALLYNWFVNGIEIPFISYNRDVTSTKDDWAEIFDGHGWEIFEPINKSAINLFNPIRISRKKYNLVNREKRIFFCLKQIPGKVKSLGSVLVDGRYRQKAVITMKYKFMPLDFLLIASLCCSAYWFYKNKIQAQ